MREWEVKITRHCNASPAAGRVDVGTPEKTQIFFNLHQHIAQHVLPSQKFFALSVQKSAAFVQVEGH
jgi:hypothetical protein